MDPTLASHDWVKRIEDHNVAKDFGLSSRTANAGGKKCLPSDIIRRNRYLIEAVRKNVPV